MEIKTHDIDSYIRRLKQIGEHEIAEMMERMYITIRGFGCTACVHYDTPLVDMPCAVCEPFTDGRNWEWKGWQNDV